MTELQAQRDARVARCIKHHAILAGAAGLVPLSYADVAGVGVVQARMIMKLAELHEVEINFGVVKQLITTMAGAGLTQRVFSWFASAIKSLPGPGTVVGEVVQCVISVTMTYAMGKAAGLYFESAMEMDSVQVRHAYEGALPEARQFAWNHREEVVAQSETLVVRQELEEIRDGLALAMGHEEEFFKRMASTMKDIAQRLEEEKDADAHLDSVLDESRRHERK